MPRCAYCNKMILFGGKRHRGHRLCSNRCLLRLMIHAEGQEDGLSGVSEIILELREDVDALTTEIADQRAALTEAVERLDFAERALVQLRNAPAVPPGSRD